MNVDSPIPDRSIPDHHVARPTLRERVRAELRIRHYSARTERAYLDWIRRYWLFCNRRDPAAFGATQVEAFLADAMRGAVRAAGIPKRATCHTRRHSFATHLLEDVVAGEGVVGGAVAVA